ncbi:unnamed protein product [Closterium sp. NIES-54]
MSKVLIAEGLGYNLLSVGQLMAKGIHLEADSTTQEFKLYNGKGGLYIGKVVLKNNVLYSHTIPEAERTRALAVIQQTTTAETTAAASTSAAAETTATPTTPTEAEATTTAPAPIASSSSAPTPTQQLTPAPREAHRSTNITASFYSNSDLYRRSPGHRADESLWHQRL